MNGARAVETAAVPGGSRIPGGSVRRPPGRGLPDLTAAARRLPGEHELVQVVQARGAASPSSAKLTLDRGLEREAARAAAAVAGRSGGIGRAGAAEGGTTSAAVPSVVDAALRSPGLPLEPDTRRLMESRFGRDFGEVRIHTDAEAAAAATAIDAIAFTAGRELVFGAGGYAPRTGEGREIIAHELTHVLQQRASSGSTAERPTEAGALDVRPAAAAPAIQRLPIKPAEEAAAYIADEDELRDRLAAMTAAQRQGLLGFVLTQVRHNWARADSLSLIEMLERVPAADLAMSTQSVQPLAGLPRNAPEQYEHLLVLPDLGRRLVVNDVTVESVTDTAESAVQAITALRRANDVLTRVLSAHEVARATGTPIADVLALSRVEGNLAVPPSLGSLEAGVPSGTSDAEAWINPTPDLSHLVWLVGPQHVAHLDDVGIREKALAQWYVRIGGLDEVDLLPSPKRESFGAWSSDWLAATDGVPSPGSSIEEAVARWDRQLENLEVRRVRSTGTGTSEAVMVAPQNSETLISGVLEEAVMRHRAGGKVVALLGALPSGATDPDLSASVAYLQFNAGVVGLRRALTSATIAASRTRGSRYAELRAEIVGRIDVGTLDPVLDRLAELDERLEGR